MHGIRGVILAGGTGSRLMPLTRVTNKHLLPVGKKPMILHPIEKMIEARINDIMVITGPEHMGSIVNLLGSGRDYQCRFTYRVQDESGGIGQALGLCQDFVGKSHCCVILGDNIFTSSIKHFVERFVGIDAGALVLLKEVTDPNRFGVAELSSDGKTILSIEEKPANPKSNLAVTGIYFYDARVFEIIRHLRPSKRNEIEISDVNAHYVKEGQMYWDRLPGDWTDAGTFPSWLLANEIMMREGGANAQGK